MATDIDWVARLRTAPAVLCPGDGELRAFILSPEDVLPEVFSHILSGCSECRSRLQEIALHPTKEQIRTYVRFPESVPEEVVFHCIECRLCQSRVRECLDE